MSFFDHAFEAPIERHSVGRSRVLWYKVLFMPEAIAAELPLARHPRLRVTGEIADVPVAGAWLPAGDGRRYFLVSPGVLKAAEVGLSDVVEMRFRIDDQDRVEMPEALTAALERDASARAVWDTLSPGRRRGLTQPIHAARTEETTARRVSLLLDGLRSEGGEFGKRRPR